jgi:Tfp pilus assembly major pilin PilA
MNNKRYSVIIINNPSLDAERTRTLVTNLSKLFKLSEEKARGILQKEQFVIKQNIDKQTAEKYHRAITGAGANCRIEEQPTEDDSALPEIEEVKTQSTGIPLGDPTRADVASLDRQQDKLDLSMRPMESSTDKNGNNKVLDEIRAENFCPDCGTIRASGDSACVHCGYDPLAQQASGNRGKVLKAVALIIILLAAGFLALPYYQQFEQRRQISNDLELAFETRNQVTAFINSTNFWPNQNIDAGLDKTISNHSIKSIEIGDNAVMTVTLRAATVDGTEHTLVFTPNTLKGQVVWNCLKGSLPLELRPDICRPQQP